MLCIYAVSLGCAKNRVDTERLLAALMTLDREVTFKDPEADPVLGADLILVNTCAFIEPATQESVRTILDLAAEIQDLDESERPVFAVAGCLPGRYGQDLAGELPEVDLFLGPGDLAAWPERIARVLEGKGRALQTPAPDPSGRVLSTGPSYAYLKISEGCDRSCSFCTIPSIRGPHASTDMGPLLREAKGLVDQGVKELVLVGQDVTAYGREQKAGTKGATPLMELVEGLLGLPKLKRLRLMYLYPAGLTPELLRFLAQAAEGSPLVPYFDVPLQHAHPDILEAMGRPFARDPRKVVDRIREALPRAALRTTLIVGFPGEEDRHFRALEEFVAQARFHNLGVFPYWPEDGTPAATMAGQVDQAAKEERLGRIMELQAGISREILDQNLGLEMEVLVDAPHPEWPGLHTGRVWFQAPDVDGVTYVSGPGVAPGALVTATIQEATDYDYVALTGI